MRDDRECDVCNLAYVCAYMCLCGWVFVRIRIGPIASLVV